jgi:streptogramin lyase
VATACIALAAIIIAAVVHDRSGGSTSTRAAPAPPAARLVARIPLGLPKAELADRVAIAGSSVWVATGNGRLLRVDPTTNQVVGSPIGLGGQHPRLLIAATGDRLYGVDSAGWVFRFDPATGHVIARRRFHAAITAIHAAPGAIWITSDNGTNGAVLRVDPTTLKPIGTPIEALPSPRQIVVQGSRAWVLGGAADGQILRIDTTTGSRTLVHAGDEVVRLALDRGTLWVPEYFGGTVSALDPGRMAFTRPALVLDRSVSDVLPLGSEIWVVAANAISDGQLRLARFDAASGRRAGSDVPFGQGTVFGTAAGLGSIWVLTPTTLTRFAPTRPQPPLAARPTVAAPPRPLAPGPLVAGRWRTTRFAVPVSLSTPAFSWIADYPEPDSFSFTAIASSAHGARLDISAPLQVFAAGATARPIPGPSSLAKMMEANPQLRVGPIRHLIVGGSPALQFKLEAKAPTRHPEVCGPVPCVLMFPVREGTDKLEAGDPVRITLLRSGGRTLVIAEDSDHYDPSALAMTAALLGTFHFEQ